MPLITDKMELKDILKSTFEDIVKAQYKAYLYALELKGEQAEDELFPIPTVKVSDATFQLKYAFADQVENTTKIVFDKSGFLKDVKSATKKVIREGIALLIEYIEKNKPGKSEQWKEIRQGLKAQSLPGFILKSVMRELRNNYSLLIDAEDHFNADFYEAAVTDHFDQYILGHFDLASLELSPGDKQWLSYSIQPFLKQEADRLEKKAKKRLVNKWQNETPIIVDAEILKTLPQKSIQNLTLTVKLDDLEELKVN